MQTILLVGIGGFFGAVARFGISYFVKTQVTHSFPLATFLINVLGCIGIGFMYEYFKDHPFMPSLLLFGVVGFLGAFTTFSTFSFETIELVRKNEFLFAFANVFGSLIFGLVGVLLGAWLGQIFN